MPRLPRVLLVDDALVVAGLRKLLEPAFDVVGAAHDGRKAVSRALDLRPDVVLLEMDLPLLGGIEAARRLRKAAPDIKLIFVTHEADAYRVAEAFRAGASGYVLKQATITELTSAIRRVLGGGVYLTPLLRADVEARSKGELTPRQRQVLRLVAEGKTTKEIATRLSISVKTVEYHKVSIAERVGVRKVAELTRYAIEHGLLGTLLFVLSEVPVWY
jgi:DNA-binding NarL/FixJ family response regulator